MLFITNTTGRKVILHYGQKEDGRGAWRTREVSDQGEASGQSWTQEDRHLGTHQGDGSLYDGFTAAYMLQWIYLVV